MSWDEGHGQTSDVIPCCSEVARLDSAETLGVRLKSLHLLLAPGITGVLDFLQKKRTNTM